MQGSGAVWPGLVRFGVSFNALWCFGGIGVPRHALASRVEGTVSEVADGGPGSTVGKTATWSQVLPFGAPKFIARKPTVLVRTS